MPDGSETPVIPKREESRDDIASSLDSAQDEDHTSDPRQAVGQNSIAEGGSTVQKRKGGRKPLYQTTEEKKQRNRRAQAAFRERRTEHIKALETEKKTLQERVEAMEEGQRRDKNENLMLKYKNSLLERILVEHNIDFKAEIDQKGLSYSPTQVPRTMTQMPVHRTVYHRSRPKPLAVDTRSPQLRRSESNATASAASSSPVVPPSGQFNYRSPVQMPLSAGQPLSSRHSPFISGIRQSESLPNVPHPSLAQRRQSAHSTTWPPAFESSLQQQSGSYPLDSSSFPVQSTSPLLQQHFSDPGTGPQFNLLAATQFPGGHGSIGQVMEAGSTGAPALGQSTGSQHGSLGQSYGMIGEDMTNYVPAQSSDPFGIDRSMQYPTQFDFTTGQRKTQE